MASMFIKGGLAAAAGIGSYEAYRLIRDYPVRRPKSYLTTPGLLAAQPAHPGAAQYMYAVVDLPDGHPGLAETEALDKHVDIFFSNPMLRLESALFKAIGYHSPRPTADELTNALAVGEQPKAELMSGFFPVVHCAPPTLLVWWTAPGPDSAKHQDLPGGTQVLAAVPNGNHQIELAYGCVARGPPAPQEGPVLSAIHVMYMRYLLDSAKRKLERELREGKA